MFIFLVNFTNTKQYAYWALIARVFVNDVDNESICTLSLVKPVTFA